MACSTGNPVTDAIVGFFDFLGDPIGTIMNGIAKAVLGAAISVYGDLVVSVPTLSTDGAAQDVSDNTQWIVVYAAVGSLLFASIRMAIERKGEAGQTALKGLLRVVLVSGGATAIVTALANLSDRYADFLFKSGAQNQIQNIGCQANGNGIEPFLLMVLSLLLLIAGVIQTVLLYIRLGIMILLLGTLPLAAAASMTDWGSGWWRKHIGWMIAWLLYKPAAGLVMFAGSAMIANESSDSGIQQQIAGIGVMLLSAISLPALLKLVVPATAALGGGSTGMSGMLGAGVNIASGARAGGGSGGSGAPMPSGMSGGAASGSAGPTGATGGPGAGAAGGETAAAGGAASGSAGPTGATGGRGAGAGGSGTAAAGRAAAAAGPAAIAVVAAQGAAQLVRGAVEGADGNAGHHS
ncbi:hypothetical protein QFZ63_000163 [Streptomyces sp. B3I7]|uniref:hypothetical protein n=1 Tax=Streptomyces sp. B3I7 TaxID=3042269 RepID=UPI00278982D8|nr:hypothetical protein [Streptomyces sp. B3I7]MDQ0808449.1 hypothetical protein [Streptomyces sp. B3I7]